jgi:hypothetical protein
VLENDDRHQRQRDQCEGAKTAAAA